MKFITTGGRRYRREARFALILGLILVIGCNPSRKTSDMNNDGELQPENAAENLAPGTALVDLSIGEITEETEIAETWPVQIKRIAGYGAATPPLVAGIKMNINVRTYFSNVSRDPGSYVDREKLTCIIRHLQMPETAEAASRTNWSLVQIFEQQK